MTKALLCLLLIAVLANGCISLSALPAASPSANHQVFGTIRIAFPGTANVGDVPTLMALDVLREQGYTIESTFYSNNDLAVAALDRDNADFGIGSTRSFWTAIAKGAEFRTILERMGIIWGIVGTAAVQSCADLDGRRIGQSSSGSLNSAMTDAYIQQKCPGAKPENVFISNTADRAAALLAEQIDATPLEYADYYKLEAKAPGKYHYLVEFVDIFSSLNSSALYTKRSYIETHPGAVKDVVRAYLTVHRGITTEPELLYKAMVKYLDMDPETARQIGHVYLKRGFWNQNGGIDAQSLAYSLDFFTRYNGLDASLTPEKVADLSPLNAVLDEIGRK